MERSTNRIATPPPSYARDSRSKKMLSLSPITRSVFQNPFSVNGEHEVPVTPELGSPTAALLARRRLSPASPAVVRRQLSASSTTSTNSQQQGPGAEQLPSPLENYRIKLSNYRGHATPSPLLREALAGQSVPLLHKSICYP